MSDEEDMTAQLLRLATGRADAPADRASRAQTAVRERWLSIQRRRAIRRRVAITTGLLAAAAVLVLMVRSNAPRDVRPPLEESLAAGERIEGQPVVRRQIDGERRILRLSLQMPLRADDAIETDQGSRAALRTADGSSIRLDRSSHARLIGPRVIELVEGGVYIATSDGSRGFEVRTPLGSVHDVGTRFEVRLAEASLRVRVRTGSVEIRRRDQIVPARAGTEATVTPGGIETRQMSTYGSDWEWTAGLAAPFAIEGRSLAAYLEHLAHEQGWTLRYADPALAQAASTIVLRGSVEGLGAEEALSVTLRTSGLEYRLRAGELLVSRGGAQ